MKKKITFIILTFLFILPMDISADNYSRLWKDYAVAKTRDLPMDQIQILNKISAAAQAGKNYGDMLMVEANLFSLKALISEDSIKSGLSNLEKRACEAETTDQTVAAVYNCILGDAYAQLSHNNDFPNAQAKSAEYFKKALQSPELLAHTGVENYGRFISKGIDSKIFNNDLLSIIGFKAKEYQLLSNYYSKAGNRTAALVAALYDVVENKPEEYGYNRKMEGGSYVARLDSLIEKYGDLPECGLVAQKKYEYIKDCSDATPAKKAEFLIQAQAKWGKYRNASCFSDYYRELTNPEFELNFPTNMLPNRSGRVAVTARNLKRVSIAVTRLAMEGDVNLSLNSDDDWKKAEKKLVRSSRIVVNSLYHQKHDYDHETQTLELPALKPGLYAVEAYSDDASVTEKRQLLVVSDVYVASIPLPKRKVRIVAVSATTGKPLAGASVDVWSGADAKHKEQVVTDSEGEATVTISSEVNRYYMRASTADDNYMQRVSVWSNFSYTANNNKSTCLKTFTDRAVYRPSQTVHVATIAYTVEGTHNTNVVAGKELTFVLRDANYKDVEKKTAKTDEFGTASVDFALPSSTMLNGRYSVYVSGTGCNDLHSFRVEEYKRPTYEVTIDQPAVEYHNGDTVKMQGHARTYSGVPVCNARVIYKVVRSRNHWLWRFYREETSSSDVLLNDTVETDANGDFTLNVPVRMPDGYNEETGKDNEKGRWFFWPKYYTFNVNAQVTDGAGESHDAEASLTLGTRPTALVFSLPERTLVDSVSTVTFQRLNAGGKEIDGEVTYWFDNNVAQSFKVKANTAVEIDWRKAIATPIGKHTLHAVCGTDTVEQETVLFRIQEERLPIDTADWSYLSAETFPADGSPVYLQLGANANVHVFYNVIAGTKVLESSSFEMDNEVKTFRLNYKEEYGEGVRLAYLWVKEGKVYTHDFVIRRPLEDKKMKLVWKTFRDKLTPGQKETWTLNISRPDFSADKINDRSRETDCSVQLLALMYDKSLDQIARNYFSFDMSLSQHLAWTNWFAKEYGNERMASAAAWKWTSSKDFCFNRFNYDFSELQYPRFYESRAVLLCAPTSASVTGYGSSRMMKIKASVSNEAMFEDNAYVSSDMSEAANNVVGSKEENESTASSAQIRENLQETAFFYPSLFAEKNGDVSIQFTLPESVTTWNFCGFAHDKYMNNGIICSEAVASKQVMVVPNVPRFVRCGDNATISSRVANMTEKALKTTVRMELLEPATEKIVFSAKKKISIAANATETVTFPFVPDGKYAMLVCRISAVGSGYSDGEQHYLPILPDRESVMNTAPFTFTGSGEKTISLEGLFPATSSDRKLTIEYTSNPAWLMIQTLPYMAQPELKNSFSLVSAYYANALGRHIMKQSPVIKRVVTLWKKEKEDKDNSLASALEKDQELKALVLSETPWVMDADNEAEQKKMLSTYFDEAAMDYRLNSQLSALKALQNADGSFSWWKGMCGSPSMTAEVLETLARLNALVGKQTETSAVINRAMAYLGTVVVSEYHDIQKKQKRGESVNIWDSHAIQYLYINALLQRELPEREKPVYTYLLSYLRNNRERNIYAKALMAIVLNAGGNKQEAREYVESIKQYTVMKPGLGRYFDTSRALYSWFDYRIPTQTAAIEAIKNVTPGDKTTLEEMRLWLLQSKHTQAWDTPINSVNAVYAFLDGNFNQLEATADNSLRVTVAGKKCSMPTPSAGLGYSKTTVDAAVPAKGNVVIRKKDTGTSWGAVYTRYADNVENLTSSASGLEVVREIVANEPASVGDRIKVRLTVKADRDYDFVQLIDKRAACMEPVEQTSGYCNGYYCVPKDNATNYYFDMLAKGTHVIETEYYIDRIGTYSTGTCTVQCAYAPEFAGRTVGKKINVK